MTSSAQTRPLLTVSIVIPTTMQRETVRPAAAAAVASIASIERAEVILVPNGTAKWRRSLEFRSPRLRVIECPIPRTSAARNVGLHEARNDVVLFTDDDCLLAPEWSETLARRLRTGDVAVATRLQMRRDGPVTTFLDYQRIFHPRPIDAATAHYGFGASVGVRRDLTDTIFDPDMRAGDDVQFGCDLRDAGISTAYITDVPPPIHVLPESLDSITTRFIRYGASNAKLFLLKDRPDFSIPHATSLYSSLCRNELATLRRFEELLDPNLRDLFATYDLILLGNILIGYLEQAGEILGREIIRVDHDALATGWLEIERRLEGSTARNLDWEQLPLDFERWFTQREGKRPSLAAEVSENLRGNAGLNEAPRVDPQLDVWADQIARRADEVWRSANEVLIELREGRVTAEADRIALRLRASGVSFREGGQMIETIAQGPIP